MKYVDELKQQTLLDTNHMAQDNRRMLTELRQEVIASSKVLSERIDRLLDALNLEEKYLPPQTVIRKKNDSKST